MIKAILFVLFFIMLAAAVGIVIFGSIRCYSDYDNDREGKIRKSSKGDTQIPFGWRVLTRNTSFYPPTLTPHPHL